MENLLWVDGSHIYLLYRGWIQELMERKWIKKPENNFLTTWVVGLGRNFLSWPGLNGDPPMSCGIHIYHLYWGWVQELMKRKWIRKQKMLFLPSGWLTWAEIFVVAWFTMENLLWDDGSHIYLLYRGWIQELMERKWIKNQKIIFWPPGWLDWAEISCAGLVYMDTLLWVSGIHIYRLFWG